MTTTCVLEAITNPETPCVHCGRRFWELIPLTTLTHLEAWATGVGTIHAHEHWNSEERDKKYLAGYLFALGRTTQFLQDHYFDLNDEYVQMGIEDAKGVV